MTRMQDFRNHRRGARPGSMAMLTVAALGVVGLTLLYQQQTRNSVPHRRPGSAPGRSARRNRFGRYAVTGRTVTIAKPRAEIYAFVRDFSNLPQFMQSVKHVAGAGDTARWTLSGPMGREVAVETRIVSDRKDSEIAWRSTERSEIETEGKIHFRDAPGGRGTEVEAIIAYVPSYGTLGHWVAKAFQADPHVQGRRDLKRLKMLMETGEIATSALRKTPA